MKKNTVTAEVIERIISEGTVEVQTIGTKTTMVAFTTKEGFVITQSSSCVDSVNYDVKMGTEICMNHIKNKLWELEGYRLQHDIAKGKHAISEMVVNVNTVGLEEAHQKMKELAGICSKIDTLQQRIIKSQDKINSRPCGAISIAGLNAGEIILPKNQVDALKLHVEQEIQKQMCVPRHSLGV